MTRGLYYTAPPEEAFEEMKRRAIDLWTERYDDTYGYRSEKISRIKDIQNVEDNFMYIFAMFDMDNQRILVSRMHPATRKELRDRMIDGGNGPEFLSMLGL